MSPIAKMSASATLHCLIGCSIGELIGVTIGTELALPALQIIILAGTLSFISGYAVSTLPLVRGGTEFWSALKLVAAADTLSIVTMIVVDNAVMASVPGAFDKDFTMPVYWFSRGIALFAAFLVAWPVNYYLIKRGKGHALTHSHHGHESHEN